MSPGPRDVTIPALSALAALRAAFELAEKVDPQYAERLRFVIRSLETILADLRDEVRGDRWPIGA